MCINIISSQWIDNIGQFLAGTGVFVNTVKGATRHDEPVKGRICRLHLEGRHVDRSLPIPNGFSLARRGRSPGSYSSDADEQAFLAALRENTAFSRGYWKTHIFHCGFNMSENNKYFTQLCSQGKWARALFEDGTYVPCNRNENFSIGGWKKDGYGCHLSYVVPLGVPLHTQGVFESESAWRPEIGEKRIIIPETTKYGLWIRCSDSESHSGFAIVELSDSFYEIHAVSLFPAPHVFPRGNFTSIDSCQGAVALAEYIHEHGEFPYS